MEGMRTVIVGYDGSPNGRRAVGAAAGAVEPGGTVHVVRAYHEPTAAQNADFWASIPEELRGQFDVLEGPRVELEEAGALLGERGIDHQLHLEAGSPAGVILDLAEELDADLIVVGSRGLGMASRFVRGSVSSRIANHAHTSFLVVHDADDG